MRIRQHVVNLYASTQVGLLQANTLSCNSPLDALPCVQQLKRDQLAGVLGSGFSAKGGSQLHSLYLVRFLTQRLPTGPHLTPKERAWLVYLLELIRYSDIEVGISFIPGCLGRHPSQGFGDSPDMCVHWELMPV